MVDLYANYFFQKFYGYLNDSDRILFLNKIKKDMVSIANNKIGTYPLQAVIDKMRTVAEKDILIDAMKDSVLVMCQDQNGVHVIEKIILCFTEADILCIYESIIDNFEVIANNANGLCVAKLIILCKNPENLKKLHLKIVNNSLLLVQNPYGNYAIQKALENWKIEDLEILIKQFCNKFYDLSKHKYSSNAVEKSLDRGGEVIMAKFIDEISYMNRVVDLMKNEYGNFVIQKALKLSENINRKKLIKLIQKNVEKIGDKKLIIKWKNIVNSYVNTNCDLFNKGIPLTLGSNQNYLIQMQNSSNIMNPSLNSPFACSDPKFLFSPMMNCSNFNTNNNNSNNKGNVFPFFEHY